VRDCIAHCNDTPANTVLRTALLQHDEARVHVGARVPVIIAVVMIVITIIIDVEAVVTVDLCRHARIVRSIAV
jgi:hypothetical protein